MTRNWLLSHWRRMAMQAALVGVLAVTIGLAAVATHQKRLALRLPLSHPLVVGRLRMAVPRGWSPPAVAEETSGGDVLSVDELLPDGVAGRRITIQRTHIGTLLPPLEYLLHTPYLSDADLSDSAQAAAGIPSRPRIQPQEVAGWPGVLLSRTVGTLGGRRLQKQVLACAVVPPAQAVIIRLEDSGPTPDVANEELVREIAENLSVRDAAGATIRPEPGGVVVELGGGVFAPVPDHFCKLPADHNRTSVDLLADGYRGGWTAVELIPCLWFPGEQEQAQFLALLSTRDRDWRSGVVKKLADGMWQVDRPADAAATSLTAAAFPTRAYCLTSGGDQAVVAILRGGWHDDSLFDAAWKAISANVRFTTRRDVPALLQEGRQAVAKLIENGAEQYLPSPGGDQIWSLWDQSENADKQYWMHLDWAPAAASPLKPPPPAVAADNPEPEPRTLWRGSRVSWPERLMAGRLYRSPFSSSIAAGGDAVSETTEQAWSGTADFSIYTQATDRTVSVHGQTTQRTAIQRWELRDGKLRNHLAADDPMPVPPEFVPGAWLPLVLGKLSDNPMILRTESFLGSDASPAQGLLTLYVARVRGEGMPCVTVSVNGTGQLTRWWYDPDGGLRYIDFPGGLRAQRN